MTSAKQLKPIWPPVAPTVEETPQEREQRLKSETEAKQISEQIDREINAERERKKKVSAVRILLLGQAESGKSTVLKNFQLHFAPKAFESGSEAWRPIIHLNLVRSVNFIVNVLSEGIPDDYGMEYTVPGFSFSPELRRLCARLAPLRQVEESLSKYLSGVTNLQESLKPRPQYHPAKASEITMPSGSLWKGLFDLWRHPASSDAQGTKRPPSIRSEDLQNRRILSACSVDIIRLWNDPVVHQCLKMSKIHLEEQPGFFLAETKRIANEDYKPTFDDILKARIMTRGPEEHVIHEESGEPSGNRSWFIYDVGGSRNQRATWAQFFDDVNVIIFLAPLSAFNQPLAEDENVNRLADSLKLWKMICGNKLLQSVEIVLFLNKLDILETKLNSGIQFSQYMPSYEGKENEVKPVVKHLHEIFVDLHKQHSPKRRKIYPHLTCAIDTRSTSAVITQVREAILVKLLSSTILSEYVELSLV